MFKTIDDHIAEITNKKPARATRTTKLRLNDGVDSIDHMSADPVFGPGEFIYRHRTSDLSMILFSMLMPDNSVYHFYLTSKHSFNVETTMYVNEIPDYLLKMTDVDLNYHYFNDIKELGVDLDRVDYMRYRKGDTRSITYKVKDYKDVEYYTNEAGDYANVMSDSLPSLNGNESIHKFIGSINPYMHGCVDLKMVKVTEDNLLAQPVKTSGRIDILPTSLPEEDIEWLMFKSRGAHNWPGLPINFEFDTFKEVE